MKNPLLAAMPHVLASVTVLLVASCDQIDPAKRSAVARLETLEAEKRIVMDKLSGQQAERDRLVREQSDNELAAQSVEQELHALLASNPLIAASLEGATSAADEFLTSQTNQTEMDSGTMLAGLLSGIYLAMNPQDAANVVSALTDLDRRKKDSQMRRAALSRELDELDAKIRASEERLAALEAESQPLIAKSEAPFNGGHVLAILATLFAILLGTAFVWRNRQQQSPASQEMGPRKHHDDLPTTPASHAQAARETGPRSTLLLRGHDPENATAPDIQLRFPSGLDEKQIIGRKHELAHMRVSNSSVSKQHAAVWRSGQNYFIEDRNSLNGTKLNGVKLEPFVGERIHKGDRVQLGDVVLLVDIQ